MRAGLARLRVLDRLTAAIAADTERAEIMRRVVGAVAQLLEVPYAVLWTVERAANHLVPAAEFVAPELEGFPPQPPIPFDGSFAGYLSQEGRPPTTTEICQDLLRINATWPGMGVLGAHLGLPIAKNGTPLGILVAMDRPGRLFTDDESDLLRSLGTHAALAIERADLLEGERRATTEAQALAEVGKLLTETMDVDTVLARIAETALDLLKAEAASVAIGEEGTEEIIFWLRAAGTPAAHPQVPLTLQRGEGVLGKAVQDRRLISSPDLLDDPTIFLREETRRWIAEMQIPRAMLAAPMARGEAVLGCLAVYRPAGSRYSSGEEQLLTALASQAAVALQNAQLFQQERERRRQLEAVRAVTGEIVRELDLGRLLSMIHRRAMDLVGAVSGTFFLWDEAAQALVPVAWHGLEEWVGDVRLKLGEGVAGTVAERREGLIVQDYRTGPHAHPQFAQRSRIAAVVAEPLLYRGCLVGVITVNHEEAGRHFTEADRETLSLFAAQAAVAIENARLYDDAERRAREATALADVGQALSESLDVNQVLDLIAQHLQRMLRVPFAGIMALDDDRKELTYVSGAGLSPDRMAQVRVPVGHGIAGEAIAERRPAHCRDFLHDPRRLVKGFAEQEGFRSLLSAPLVAHDHALGVINIFRRDTHEFLPAEVNLLVRFADQAAVAIEKARVFQQERARRQQLEAVRAVTEELLRERDLGTLLQRINRLACELVRAGSGMVCIWDEAAQVLVPQAWFGMGDWLHEARFRLGEGVIGSVAERREGLVINDYDGWAKASATILQRQRPTAVIGEPLVCRGQLLGAFTIDNLGTGRLFTAQDREILALFADTAALAIENARLYEDSQRRAREATALAEVGRLLTSSLDRDRVFDLILGEIRRLMEATHVQILLLDESRQELTFAKSLGCDPERLAGVRLKVGEGISGRAVAHKEPLQSSNLPEDPRFVSLGLTEVAGARSLLSVPLLVGGRALGAIAVFRPEARAFTPAEVNLLTRLASHAALAMDNARLFAEVKGARDFLESIAANSADGILTTDADGHITYVSPGAEKFLGSPAAEVLGRSVSEFTRGGPAEELAVMERLLAGDQIRDYETSLRNADGHWMEASLSMSVLRHAAGQVVGSVRVARDISERRRAEDELRKLSRAVEQSPSTIIITDTAGCIEYVNPKFTRVTGYPPEEVLGQNPRFMKSGETPPAVYQALWETITAGGEWRGELHNRRKDGTLFWEAASISAIRNGDGAIAHFLAVKEDITERKKAEEQLRQNEKLATMGELLAGVAHELNNPLSTVMGQATLLCLKAGESPLADRAKKIMEAAERCGRIVKNFLTLARQRPPEREQVSLNQIIREVVELLAYPLRVDTVQVALDLSPDVPLFWADPYQLHQVLVNLITNAHHAMRATPPPRRLTFTTRFDPHHRQINLMVADTGPGIPDALQARIFEPFFTTKPTGQGTGLGLSLCQGIIEGHGGSIRAEKQPGQGAVFRVELPADAQPASAGAVEPPEESLPMSRKTILVVEDEPLIAELLGEILSAEGHQVETAANGAEALDKIGTRTYDLILSDVRMPGMDGPSLYREVARAHPALRRRFIFITGDSLTPQTRDFLQSARVPSVTKPFTPELIRQVVQRSLRGQQGDSPSGT